MNLNEDLRKWVAEKWVDIGAPKKGGGFKPCGRQKGEKRRGYPKCVPLAKATSMSQKQRRLAVKRKRAAPNDGPKPDFVSTEGKNEMNDSIQSYLNIFGTLLSEVSITGAQFARGRIGGNPSRKRLGPEDILVKGVTGKSISVPPDHPRYKEFQARLGKNTPTTLYSGTKIRSVSSKGDKRGKAINASVERIGDLITEVAAWQKSEGKNPEGGLNKKGIASYRAANPGSKLSMAVTTKPSKLKKGSKAAKRRRSFCARMSGMKKRLTSAKTAKDPNSRINKSLRKWNC